MFSALHLAIAVLLCIFNLVKADNSTEPAVSNLYISDTQTTIAINLPPDSDDLNFFIQSPAWYSYVAIGIGGAMANSLMLVAYSAADNQHITVSTRLGTGDSEPPTYPNSNVTLHDDTSIQNGNFVVSGTCTGCRSWPGGALDPNTTTQAFIFALGPNIPLASNDQSAGIRRHNIYGHFTMNTIQATGPGGAAILTTVDPTTTTGAAMTGDIYVDANRATLAHGLIMALVTLVIAPVDILVAGVLRRWPVLHIITSTGYLAFMIGGFAMGIKISGPYIATKNFGSAHQVLGFIALGVMVVLLAMGIMQFIARRAALRRGQDPKERESGPLVTFHVWGGRLLWLILLVTAGLGLALAAAKQLFIIGYSVLAAGVVIIMGMIQLCIFCFFRKEEPRKEEEDSAYQLAQLYVTK